jgi:hypothetical protein
MPKPAAALAASDVEIKIRKILGHDGVTVKPYGRHFLIQMDDNGQLGDDTGWSASATTTPVHGVALNRADS